MKKVVMLVTAILLGTLVSTPAYADTDADVWCETNVGKDNVLSVSVETNGKATDGVIVINYDSSVVTCTEADVKIADSVDMYSVNVVDESVRISFLAEEAMKAGAVAEVVFETADKDADKDALENAVSFAGEAYNESGEAVVVKKTETETPGTPGGSDDNSGGNGSGGSGSQTTPSAGVSGGNISTSGTVQSAKTGDTAETAFLILVLAAGALVAAGAGRKINH